MAKSALRSKDALMATVSSVEWEYETSNRRMKPEQRTEAAKVKAICMDTANWLKCAALLRFLQPLVSLQTLMSTDIGSVLPFFFIGMYGIQKVWESQPFPDCTKGFGGVSFKYATRANKILYNLWMKHTHLIDGTCALLHPYNHIKLVALDSTYLHLRVGNSAEQSQEFSIFF
jgi:hypothetical protein